MVWVVVGAVLHLAVGKVMLFRYINGAFTDAMNSIMYYTTWMGTAQFIVPVLMIPMLSERYRTRRYVALASACSLLPFVVLHVLKAAFAMPRPLHYYQHTTWVHVMPHWDRVFENSFPSGHTEGAFSLFCFLAAMTPYRYRFMGAVYFLVALAVGYSRIYLTAHFFEDVYAGSIVGVFFTLMAYEFMRRYYKPGLEPLT